MDEKKESKFEARKRYILSGLELIDKGLELGQSYEQMEKYLMFGASAADLPKNQITSMYACAMILLHERELALTKLNAQKESPVQ